MLFVEISISSKNIKTACGCPYESGGVCKHIIATAIVWCEKRGEVSATLTASKLSDIIIARKHGGAMKGKNIYVIAGPNGSGKTTFAMKFLPEYVKCPNFINADLIAKGLAPFEPERAAIKAGKMVLEQIQEYVDKGFDFAFETTLSGKSYYNLMKKFKTAGYGLHLFFLWLPAPELAIARIKDRVAEGGHNIPNSDVRRRFGRGIKNFLGMYEKIFDTWLLFDNSSQEPVLIAKMIHEKRMILRADLFEKILKQGDIK
jgi:predicted ABC-type ATPase